MYEVVKAADAFTSAAVTVIVQVSDVAPPAAAVGVTLFG